MLQNKAIQFVLIFILSYLVLNGLYQLMLGLYGSNIDIFTRLTTATVCVLFENFDYKPSLLQVGNVLIYKNQKIINITEGCNGIAITITLISFCLAYKSHRKNYILFLPLAIFFLHLINIIRIYWLALIKYNYQHFFSFFHVYLFPAILYATTFGLLVIWVKIIHSKETKST